MQKFEAIPLLQGPMMVSAARRLPRLCLSLQLGSGLGIEFRGVPEAPYPVQRRHTFGATLNPKPETLLNPGSPAWLQGRLLRMPDLHTTGLRGVRGVRRIPVRTSHAHEVKCHPQPYVLRPKPYRAALRSCSRSPKPYTPQCCG